MRASASVTNLPSLGQVDGVRPDEELALRLWPLRCSLRGLRARSERCRAKFSPYVIDLENILHGEEIKLLWDAESGLPYNTHQLRRVELGKVKLDAVHPVSVSPEVRGEALLLQLCDLCVDLFRESAPLGKVKKSLRVSFGNLK